MKWANERCPNCDQKLHFPCDRGELKITCPRCRHSWVWKNAADKCDDATACTAEDFLLVFAQAWEKVCERDAAAAGKPATRNDFQDLWEYATTQGGTSETAASLFPMFTEHQIKTLF